MASPERQRDGYRNPPSCDFIIRHINEATEKSLKVFSHSALRPTMSVFHYFDETTIEAANHLIRNVSGNEEKLLKGITAKSLLALFSTNHELYVKIPIVNLAIEWLLLNDVEPSFLNSLIMSLHIRNLHIDRIAKIRLGIHVYLTTPELNQFFNIRLRSNAHLFIKKKPGKPLTDSVLDTCRIINKITDKHKNQFWPVGTRRQDPEKPRYGKKGKLVPAIRAFCEKQIQNPLFTWDFDPEDYLVQSKYPFYASIPSESYIRQISLDKEKSEIARSEDPEGVETAPVGTFSFSQVQRKLMKPVCYQADKKEAKVPTIITATTSSGYQSMSTERSVASEFTAPSYRTVYEAPKTMEKRGENRQNFVPFNNDANHNRLKSQSKKFEPQKIPVNVRRAGDTRYPQGFAPRTQYYNNYQRSQNWNQQKYQNQQRTWYKPAQFQKNDAPFKPATQAPSQFQKPREQVVTIPAEPSRGSDQTSESSVSAFLAKPRSGKTPSKEPDSSERQRPKFFFNSETNVIEMEVQNMSLQDNSKASPSHK